MFQNIVKQRLKPLIAPAIGRLAFMLVGALGAIVALTPEQIATGEAVLTALFLWFIDVVASIARSKGVL